MRAVPIMKTCEKLCEKIDSRILVSANDVVQTCLEVCFLSELDMLQRRPPDTCSSSVKIALPCGFPSTCSLVLVKRSVSGGCKSVVVCVLGLLDYVHCMVVSTGPKIAEKQRSLSSR